MILAAKVNVQLSEALHMAAWPNMSNAHLWTKSSSLFYAISSLYFYIPTFDGLAFLSNRRVSHLPIGWAQYTDWHPFLSIKFFIDKNELATFIWTIFAIWSGAIRRKLPCVQVPVPVQGSQRSLLRPWLLQVCTRCCPFFVSSCSPSRSRAIVGRPRNLQFPEPNSALSV